MSATISEFDLIERYFTRTPRRAALGVGDDCAIVGPVPDAQILMSTDMLAAGTHFFADTDAEALGWKVLAVNVSDIAAMGATPRWALLAMALPSVDEEWIAAFARGFFACADTFGVELIGGDTTRGPMNFCVTIIGDAPSGEALLRSGARADDDIWVSGWPGRAALGLAHLRGQCTLDPVSRDDCLAALLRPQPRIQLGLGLRGVASAAIDVSDGLLADLGHILDASTVAADLDDERMPWLATKGIDDSKMRDSVLAGGDDYELAFTASASRRAGIKALGASLSLPLTRIGRVVAPRTQRLRLLDASGSEIPITHTGYDHFR